MLTINKIIAYSTKNLSKIVALITSILIVLAIYYAAKLTWLVLTPNAKPSPWQPPSIAHSGSATSSINFSNFHWFGKPNAQPVEERPQQEITDAPKTSLNMTLTGVVANSDVKRSMAIIEYQAKQDTYVINQKIPSSRASIAEIHHDRVILKNNGRYETLMLDGFDYSKPKPATQTNRKKLSAGPKKQLGSKFSKTRQEILADPGKIMDYIAISPVSTNGKVKGYRLNPGRNPELFRASGLKPRDLAVAINGYDLSDPTQSIRVMSELRNMNNIMITVERDGQLTDIEFALP
ncbi:MAG: type II secretion system protein GspC [Psychrobium sp.]